MNTLRQRIYFKQNGKALKTVSSLYSTRSEKISSLYDGIFDTPLPKKSAKEILKNMYISLSDIYKSRSFFYLSMTIIFTTITIVLYSSYKRANSISIDNGQYSIFSAKPLTHDISEQSIYAQDSRSQKINEVFKIYNCPLEGMGEVFVREADKYDIPWWLTASVAFQESSCGKNTPKIDGQESYNAWGWGVYGDTVHTFDNWARGIETVSEYFRNKFYSKNKTDLCEIMKTYTPPSNGSWCQGVGHFAEIFQNFKTPAELSSNL